MTKRHMVQVFVFKYNRLRGIPKTNWLPVRGEKQYKVAFVVSDLISHQV